MAPRSSAMRRSISAALRVLSRERWKPSFPENLCVNCRSFVSASPLSALARSTCLSILSMDAAASLAFVRHSTSSSIPYDSSPRSDMTDATSSSKADIL